MAKKYFKYIVLTFILMFGLILNVDAKAELINIKKSEVKANYCEYGYDGITIILSEGFDGELNVKTSGYSKEYSGDYNDEYLKGDNYIKQRNCPNINIFLFQEKVLYFSLSENFSDITDMKKLTTISGNLKRITTKCIYEAEGAKFIASYNPVTKDMIYPVTGVYKIQSKAKKNWVYNENGLVCRDDIVIDVCATGAYIRTTAEAMVKTCGKSTHPGGITITEKDDKVSKDGILYLSDMCDESVNVIRIVRIIGYLLLIVKILVPIGLIIFGIINFTRAVISGKEDDTKKVAIGLIWKFIAAVVIFVLPTIINFIISLIDGATDGSEDYENCRICIFDPSNCQIPN